jgi:chromosome segregation ATPase
MNDSLERIRQHNLQKAENEAKDRQHQEQVQASKSLEKVLFQSFQSLVTVLEGDKTKGQAIALIADALDELKDQHSDSHTEVATIKAGLEELEKQIKDIPSDSLKKLPKFLQARETIKVTNLHDLDKGFESVEKAIKAMKLHVAAPEVKVDAPIVNVPETVVNVPEVDLMPLQATMQDVIKAIKTLKPKLEDGATETKPVNVLVSERFDEYRLVYDTFDDTGSPQIEAINYFLKNKRVARVEYKYNDDGLLLGGKKVKV